jgi:hypothetical protein
MAAMSDAPPPPRLDLSLAEAARRLGVSSSTVRRLVKAAKLAGRTVPTKQGFAYRVWLPDAPAPAPQPVKKRRPPYGAQARNAVAEALAPLVERMEALTREVQQLRMDLAALRNPPKPPHMGHAILPPTVPSPPLPHAVDE